MEVASSPSSTSSVSDPRSRKGCVARWSSVFLRHENASASLPRPYATHLLSASDSDFSANNPPVSRTSTPCRDNWTEARVTPEAVEGKLVSLVSDGSGKGGGQLSALLSHSGRSVLL